MVGDHDPAHEHILSGPPLNSPDPALPTSANPEGRRGLQAVIHLDGFRRLWVGQIFSQLADKFYIVLMVYLIAQYWVTNTPDGNGALAEIASAIRMVPLQVCGLTAGPSAG